MPDSQTSEVIPDITPRRFHAGDEILVHDPNHPCFGWAGVVRRECSPAQPIVPITLTRRLDGSPTRILREMYAWRLCHLTPEHSADLQRQADLLRVEQNRKRREIECPKVNLP